MKKLICTPSATGLSVKIEGTNIIATGRTLDECLLDIIKHHAAKLDIEIAYNQGPTATPVHLVAVLKGEDREAEFGPMALRPLLLELAALHPEMVFMSVLDSQEKTAEKWAASIREMDAGEMCFLRRSERRGPRQIQIIMQKMAFYNEVTTDKTPGYQAPKTRRGPAAPRRPNR